MSATAPSHFSISDLSELIGEKPAWTIETERNLNLLKFNDCVTYKEVAAIAGNDYGYLDAPYNQMADLFSNLTEDGEWLYRLDNIEKVGYYEDEKFSAGLFWPTRTSYDGSEFRTWWFRNYGKNLVYCFFIKKI